MLHPHAVQYVPPQQRVKTIGRGVRLGDGHFKAKPDFRATVVEFDNCRFPVTRMRSSHTHERQGEVQIVKRATQGYPIVRMQDRRGCPRIDQKIHRAGNPQTR